MKVSALIRIALFIILAGLPNLAVAAEITWRVVHPFRFFTETMDFQMQIDAYEEIKALNQNRVPDDVVMQMEHKLNNEDWLGKWLQGHRESIGEYGSSKGEKLYTNYSTNGNVTLPEHRPSRGWAQFIESRSSTCWDERTQWHSNCNVDSDPLDGKLSPRTSYVRPKNHSASLLLSDPPSGNCTWSSTPNILRPNGLPDISAIFRHNGTALFSVTAPCSESITVRIAFEPDLPETERGTGVRVRLPNGDEKNHPPIWVKDRLIVGLGDSYSSGEGNPDGPVQLEQTPDLKGDWRNNTPKNNPQFYKAGVDGKLSRIGNIRAFPLALKANGSTGRARAQWMDRRCHRSAYSYHLRTAIQLALQDYKHSTVTFLGYACSGAEIVEGLLDRYKGKEDFPNKIDKIHSTDTVRQRKDMGQINRLIEELCAQNLVNSPGNYHHINNIKFYKSEKLTKKNVSIYNCTEFIRDVDLFIVSVGGNDVGFSSLIARVLLHEKPTFEASQSLVGTSLRNSLVRILAEAFGVEHSVAVAKRKLEILPENYGFLDLEIQKLRRNPAMKPAIMLTGFPIFTTDENGKFCGTSSQGENSLGRKYDGVGYIGLLKISDQEINLASTFAKDQLLPTMKATEKRLKWKFVESHIANFKDHGFCAHEANSTRATEQFDFPYFLANPPRGTKRGWQVFAPVDFKPYASRERWMRTFHDACLMVQYQKSGNPVPAPINMIHGELKLLESCMGGPMHPTAEGHAAYADAAFKASLGLLFP